MLLLILCWSLVSIHQKNGILL